MRSAQINLRNHQFASHLASYLFTDSYVKVTSHVEDVTQHILNVCERELNDGWKVCIELTFDVSKSQNIRHYILGAKLVDSEGNSHLINEPDLIYTGKVEVKGFSNVGFNEGNVYNHFKNKFDITNPVIENIISTYENMESVDTIKTAV